MILTLNKLLNKLSVIQMMPRISTYCRHLSSVTSPENDSDSDDLYRIERNFEELSVESFRELVTDKTTENKIVLILSEYEYQKYTTFLVPTKITISEMKDLLTLDDSEYRKRWFSYLCKRELAKIKRKGLRKQHSEEYWTQKRKAYDESNSDTTGIWDKDHKLVYGLWHNTLFSKILKNSVNRYYSHRLRTAALFGPKLVIDLDYDKYMNLGECRSLANQIHSLYNWNRYRSTEPFDLHFTNCVRNESTIQAIHKVLPNSRSPHFLADFHQKSYLDLFPKERLVYLSSHSEKPMKQFNCDDIHIIGGHLDKSSHKPLSYIKAKKEGIRCVKLPIEEHIIKGEGYKTLALNHFLQILHDINVTGDWSKALKDNIPQNMQKTVKQIEYEDMLREKKFNRSKKVSKFDEKKENN